MLLQMLFPGLRRPQRLPGRGGPQAGRRQGAIFIDSRETPFVRCKCGTVLDFAPEENTVDTFDQGKRFRFYGVDHLIENKCDNCLPGSDGFRVTVMCLD